jgi:hypothetical protein
MFAGFGSATLSEAGGTTMFTKILARFGYDPC